MKLWGALTVCLAAGCSAPPQAAQTGERSRQEVALLREQSVLDALNRLRTDPQAFADLMDARIPFYQGQLLRLPGRKPLATREGVAALTEAVDALDDVKPLSALQFSPALHRAAAAHGRDIGARGVVSHEGSGGSTPSDRMKQFAGATGATGEAISFGLDEPEDIIIELVVDDGVPSRAHRKLLLSPDFHFAAVACVPHSYYNTVCVIDLAHSAGNARAR